MKISQVLALFWMALLLVGAAVVEIFFPGAAYETKVDQILLSPQVGHWLGTDSLGRDLLARILSGTWMSLSVGIFGSCLALAIGVFLGGGSAWFGGWSERLMMRFTDLLLSVPSFALVAVVAMSLSGAGIFGLILAVGLTRWMSIARVTRGLVLSTKNLPYIEASRAMGCSHGRILWSHVRPNIAGPLLVLLGLQIPSNIIYESFMSFIGLGAQAPQTSWGLLVQEGWKSLSSYPHLILAPAGVLFLTVWSLHVLMEKIGRGKTLSMSWLESGPRRV